MPLLGSCPGRGLAERKDAPVAAAGLRRSAHVARLLAALRTRRRSPRTRGSASTRWRGRCCRRCRCCFSSAPFTGCPTSGSGRSVRTGFSWPRCLSILGLLSAGHQARHLGLLWIATEAATLATVPLLHFNGTPRAFEATWKYLLIGGTGIALSLLGSFCLGYASLYGGGTGDLTFAALVAQGAASFAAMGPHRVGAPAGRLRNEDGAGADAHLEAGRLRRGAGHRRRDPRGRRDHRGVHRNPARARCRGGCR